MKKVSFLAVAAVFCAAVTERTSAETQYTRLASIENSAKTAWIDTGYRPTKDTRVLIDYQFLNLSATQYRVFGVESGDLFFSVYENGSYNWAYAFQNRSGNWKTDNKRADSVRHETVR